MENLSIEEKARRYDEVVEKFDVILNLNTVKESGTIFADDVIKILPELRESEDERIKNEIISAIEEDWPGHTDWIVWPENRGETFTKKDVDDAYLKGICDAKHELEKQGKQNTVVVIPKFRVGDVIRPKGSTAEYIIESISGECYHGEGWGLHISCDDDYELVKQKSAWSQEDEKMLDTVIEDIIKLAGPKVCYHKDVDWLKALKGRVQPKVELTQLDKNILEAAIAFVEQNNHFYCWRGVDKHTVLSALHSLRSQNHRKPSELPHWKKSNLQNDNTTGFNSDYFCHNGYCINYKELFEKLPKDD